MSNQMTHLQDEKYRKLIEQRATVMKAMAHPSRMLMVCALEDGPRCVCELQELVGHDVSTVSKHLSVLKNAGIVDDEKRGKNVFYRLRVPCVLKFMHCIDSVLKK